MVYMDIDYMQDYKDFTVNEERFPDFEGFVQDMKKEKIHLVPIIDAGVKVEEGYDIYEEGCEKGYFCRREDGSYFEATVWPGWTHFPDVLNADARKWFGDKYDVLVSKGIDAFWNDMNEPSIFYSQEGLADFKETAKKYVEGDPEVPHYMVGGKLQALANNHEDYKRFYHNVNGEQVRHDKVHNLFGYNMTRSAGEAFERISPDKRILMFSRSSYIGMHRYGGIWTGDNCSWWSHILLNLKMMPSLNMCGFLYTGADLGGFGANTTRDLLLRWLALGVFTPLMRNHAALGTREQEPYQFEHIEDFRNVIGIKEASGDIEQMQHILDRRPEGFIVLSGDDGMAIELMRRGGDGVISVAANAFPQRFMECVNHAKAGDFDAAEKAYAALDEAVHALFEEGNPVGVKCALSVMGRIGDTMRLPLVAGSGKLRAKFEELIARYDLR